MPSDVEVPHLVRAASQGDQHAWNALVEQFAPLVWAVARGHGLASASALDVAQTTWLRLVESLDSVDGKALGPWLAAGTRTESLHALRWADPRVELRVGQPQADTVLLAVESVPARSRLALRLLAVHDVSMDEVAAGLGLGVTEAEALVAQSLDRLAAALEGSLTTEVPR